jgi:hypothetical protein
MFEFTVPAFSDKPFHAHDESKFHNLIHSICLKKGVVTSGPTNYDTEKLYLSYIKKEIKENDNILPGDVVLLSREYNSFAYYSSSLFYSCLIILDSKGEKNYINVDKISSSKSKHLPSLLKILLKQNIGFFENIREMKHGERWMCFNLQNDSAALVKKNQKKLSESV